MYYKPRSGASYVVSLVHIQVCIHIPLVCAPDRAGHAGPWLLECQNALNVVSMNLFARNRVDNRRLDTEERKRGTTWLGGGYTSKRSDDVGTSLSLPVCLEFVNRWLAV